MDFSSDPDHETIRDAVKRVCAQFPDSYWRECDEAHEFPWAFYGAMAEGGWIGIAIPEEFGGGGLDQRTRMVPCRVRVDRPTDVYVAGKADAAPPALMRGMFVTVEIHTKPRQQLVKIPASAIQPGNKMWRVRDGKLNLVEDVELVKSILVDDENYWIIDPTETGLEVGDQIVVSSLPVALDGMAVQIASEVPQP